MKAKDYRRLAEEDCGFCSGTLALTELVFDAIMVVVGLFGLIPYAGIALGTAITLVIIGPIHFSFVYIAKEVRDHKKPMVEDLFSGFKRFAQAFVLDLLTSIFVALWTLLLIVPGIIKAYAYSQAAYICYEDPNKSSTIAIDESKKLMYGHKWELFCLDISYIGWYLLCILTLGILSLWVAPKHRQARYHFYLNLTKKVEQPSTISQ